MSGGTLKTREFREMRTRELLNYLKLFSAPMPLQLALGYLASGDPDSAVAELYRARDAHDPLMIWAHLWPFLDPLRGHGGFRQLIREMGFPAAP